jgi:site-specific DNA-methyltransferase (adenine-specific)
MKIEEMLNKVICGDCLEVMKDIPDKSVDCIVTSPPYWKGFAYEAYFNSYKQYLDWSKLWLKECKRVLKQNGTLYLNVINDSEITIRAFELMEIATRDLMYKLHETIIWYRYNQQPANTKRQLTNQCEFVFMLRHSSTGIELDKESAYKNAPEMFKTKNVGNVWELPFNAGKVKNNFGKKETESKWGHGGFPVKLPETCILLSTKENDIVLDLFAGSGTTGVACKNLNRNYILIEKEPEYIDIINKRLNTLNQDKLL